MWSSRVDAVLLRVTVTRRMQFNAYARSGDGRACVCCAGSQPCLIACLLENTDYNLIISLRPGARHTSYHVSPTMHDGPIKRTSDVYIIVCMMSLIM